MSIEFNVPQFYQRITAIHQHFVSRRAQVYENAAALFISRYV